MLSGFFRENMKKIKKTPIVFALFLFIAALIPALISSFGHISAGAVTSEEIKYSYFFENYEAVYDVRPNRSMRVTETLTVHYTGTESTGFIKYLPVNGGEQVRNVKIYEMSGNTEKNIPYYVYTEQDDSYNNYMCFDIGSTSRKTGETHTYVVEYDFCLTKAQEGENSLYLNIIGVDRLSYCNIADSNVKLILPQGYVGGKCYVGKLGSTAETPFTAATENGRFVLKLENQPLAYNEGVTFLLDFEDGALSTYSEFTPYWFVIAGLAFLIVLITLKVTVFNKGTITPVVNFEAPDGIDPLMMGKLIDNTVNNEDITSLIFYWADKGFLKINFEDQDDPVLIKTIISLPSETPDYQIMMFNALFRDGEIVKISSLQNRFYITVSKVTAAVNSKVKGLYSGKSLGISLLFAFLGGILPGFAALIISAFTISLKYLVLAPLITAIPLLAAYGLTEALKYNSLKLNKRKKALYFSGIAILCVAITAVYTFLMPNWIIDYLPKAILCAVSCIISVAAVLLVNRTEYYTGKLNSIIGFRNFIRLSEKDVLEKMLEQDPQFYYHVLPYAQVLGVSDIWEEKFQSLTVEPPQWATYSAVHGIIHFHMMNSIIKSSFSNMSKTMVSRPSSSGSGGHGGFGGGFGGGHVGGGHGGGGFRGR